MQAEEDRKAEAEAKAEKQKTIKKEVKQPTKKEEPETKKTSLTESAADKVRNEGVEGPKDKEQQSGQEIDLEIEAPGAANSVAEEGSMTI